LNEAEALAGISNREVIHPAAQYRVDQLDHPICGLVRIPMISPRHSDFKSPRIPI
jgi:hypothetical protein